jgi:hypothetical protein
MKQRAVYGKIESKGCVPGDGRRTQRDGPRLDCSIQGLDRSIHWLDRLIHPGGCSLPGSSCVVLALVVSVLEFFVFGIRRFAVVLSPTLVS